MALLWLPYFQLRSFARSLETKSEELRRRPLLHCSLNTGSLNMDAKTDISEFPQPDVEKSERRVLKTALASLLDLGWGGGSGG